MQLRRTLHTQVVTGASPDQGHLCADHRVRAAHDLLLVASEPVAEDQQHPMGGGCDLLRYPRHRAAGLPQPQLVHVRCRRCHAEARAAESHDDHTAVRGATRGDLAGGRAPDQRHTRRRLTHRFEQLRQRVGVGGEHHQQLGLVATADGLQARRPPGLRRVRDGR